jgi:hypothetical protein
MNLIQVIEVYYIKETEEEIIGSCGWSNDKFKIVLEICMVFYRGEF